MVLQVFTFRVEKIKYALVFLRNGMHQNFTPHDINLLNSFGYGVSGLEKALDDSQIFYSLTEKPSIKENLSPEFYFLVIVNSYMKEHVKNKNPVFYLTNILVRFIKSDNLKNIPELGMQIEHISDALIFGLKCADFGESNAAFHAFKHGGDAALFLSGIFYKNIEDKRSALSINDYVNLGADSFSKAVSLAKAYPRGMGFFCNPKYFRTAQKALNRIADYHMGFDDEITRIWKRPVA